VNATAANTIDFEVFMASLSPQDADGVVATAESLRNLTVTSIPDVTNRLFNSVVGELDHHFKLVPCNVYAAVLALRDRAFEPLAFGEFVEV
jgi:hypothetical protein